MRAAGRAAHVTGATGRNNGVICGTHRSGAALEKLSRAGQSGRIGSVGWTCLCGVLLPHRTETALDISRLRQAGDFWPSGARFKADVALVACQLYRAATRRND